MKSLSQTHHFGRSAFAAVIVAVCAGFGISGNSAGNELIQIRELQAALALSQEQLAAEKARADQLEVTRKALVKSLAEAVRVSEEQVLASRETQLTLQAFGIDLLTKEEGSLEKRLLKAVRDLDIAQQENERQSKALHNLSEAFLGYLGATSEAPKASRKKAEDAIAEAARVITPLDEAIASGPQNTTVVSFDDAIGLIVLDAGKRDGLRVGTPVTVTRAERPIFTAMIVDVRDSISGAVLQDRLGDSAEVAVGDGIQILPNQNQF